MTTRIVAWFSCGAASAVAAKRAIEKYGTNAVAVVYCDTSANEHQDNQRFFNDVQSWIGKDITRLKSAEAATIEEVFEKRRYMSGPHGAPCTVELKKKPRFNFQLPDDINIFGFTADESKRITKFKQRNPELQLEWILQDQRITKKHCLRILQQARIAIPTLYRQGYKNNNCIGCVKATSAKYWNMIRRDYPEVFERRVKQSREIGARLTRVNGERIFLDELPEDYMGNGKLENISCGPDCGALPGL